VCCGDVMIGGVIVICVSGCQQINSQAFSLKVTKKIPSQLCITRNRDLQTQTGTNTIGKKNWRTKKKKPENSQNTTRCSKHNSKKRKYSKHISLTFPSLLSQQTIWLSKSTDKFPNFMEPKISQHSKFHNIPNFMKFQRTCSLNK